MAFVSRHHFSCEEKIEKDLGFNLEGIAIKTPGKFVNPALDTSK